ncbi:MAG: N-acetylmuramoyl-L-alanine amidase, partial [Melioribacteraceae bacterium]|nr:N-acetylmuramoyl-L-alanine amidase [Melioribacteraceae bacterium]
MRLSFIRIKLLIITIPIFALVGCSGAFKTNKEPPKIDYSLVNQAYFEYPQDLLVPEITLKKIDSFKEALTGKKIFIDPGHGGADRRNKSRNGALVEADVNLRVAIFLKEFCESAGAQVKLSREVDSTVELLTRPILAEEFGADIFISVHHNASPDPTDFWTNFTSTYYHAKPGSYKYEPFAHELARFVQRDLAYAMMNSGGLGSFDGTYSDYRIYPGDGFAVLRESKIPSILIECSFHTNRMEEIRLASGEFNRIQAWGIFKGIGKFFSVNRPIISLVKDESKLVNGTLNLGFQIESTEEIDPFSIKTFFDSTFVNHEFNQSNSIITFSVSDIEK